jgi:hypothetical protein
VRYDRTIVSCHGTDAESAEAILAGGRFLPSEKTYDWLGKGVYFWEFGYDRAVQWAQEHRPLAPAVVGAVILLGICIDLLDTRFTRDLAQGASAFAESWIAANGTLPSNGGRDRKARHLDCAVINWWLDRLGEMQAPHQTVRCAFSEGDPVYPGMEIMLESHVQVAVRDPSCILGVYRHYPADAETTGESSSPSPP